MRLGVLRFEISSLVKISLSPIVAIAPVTATASACVGRSSPPNLTDGSPGSGRYVMKSIGKEYAL